MLANCLRRWTNLKLTLFQCFEFEGNTGNRPTTDHPRARWLENPIDLREVEPMSGQCRLTVCYTGPMNGQTKTVYYAAQH